MNRNTKKSIVAILLAFFFFQACTSTKDRFKGKTATPDQVYTITNNDKSTVWDTKELSVNFFSASSLSENFTLQGDISISEQITNSYPKIRRLIFSIHFLDSNKKVISTKNIPVLYSVYGITPEKIQFNLKTPLPVDTVAFCFSYSGEFQSDSKVRESKYIGNKPFHEKGFDTKE